MHSKRLSLNHICCSHLSSILLDSVLSPGRRCAKARCARPSCLSARSNEDAVRLFVVALVVLLFQIMAATQLCIRKKPSCPRVFPTIALRQPCVLSGSLRLEVAIVLTISSYGRYPWMSLRLSRAEVEGVDNTACLRPPTAIASCHQSLWHCRVSSAISVASCVHFTFFWID